MHIILKCKCGAAGEWNDPTHSYATGARTFLVEQLSNSWQAMHEKCIDSIETRPIGFMKDVVKQINANGSSVGFVSQWPNDPNNI